MVAGGWLLGYNTRPPRDNGEEDGRIQTQTGRQAGGQEEGRKTSKEAAGGEETGGAQARAEGQGTGAQTGQAGENREEGRSAEKAGAETSSRQARGESHCQTDPCKIHEYERQDVSSC